jgi:hypothetical protein
MSDEPKKGMRAWPAWIALALYPLSIGPVFCIVRHTGTAAHKALPIYSAIYRPLDLVIHICPPIGRAIESWMKVWNF